MKGVSRCFRVSSHVPGSVQVFSVFGTSGFKSLSKSCGFDSKTGSGSLEKLNCPGVFLHLSGATLTAVHLRVTMESGSSGSLAFLHC